MLLADLAERGQITQEEKNRGHNAIVSAIKKAWAGGLTRKVIEDAYGDVASKLAVQIDLADGSPISWLPLITSLAIRDSLKDF